MAKKCTKCLFGALRLGGGVRRLAGLGSLGAGAELEKGAVILSAPVADPGTVGLTAFRAQRFIIMDTVLATVDVASTLGTQAMLLL